jgi:hypothetical protein
MIVSGTSTHLPTRLGRLSLLFYDTHRNISSFSCTKILAFTYSFGATAFIDRAGLYSHVVGSHETST